MPALTLIITIAPDRDGKTTMSVSFCGADGAPAGPAREVVLNDRLAAFVADMQALARQKLATLERPPERLRARCNRQPTIADAINRVDVR